jgi:hypothetical protein
MSKDRQPWPMKWVAVAIILLIVPYTYLTLHYRKPGPAFRPYEDLTNRANVARLLSAGYQRIPLPAQLPADRLGSSVSATIASASGGLPTDLKTTLAQGPLLPAEITQVSAPPDVSAVQPYAFRFACTLPDEKRQLAGADLYLKGSEIVIAPDYEKLSGQLLNRSRDNVVQLTVPAGALKPGRYHVTLVAQNASRTWMLVVK